MKERPILFSGAMVRALLVGTKTQTRRVVKPALSGREWVEQRESGGFWRCADGEPTCYTGVWETHEYAQQFPILCPYGQPGDRLWVREAFAEEYDYCDHPEMPGAPTEHFHFGWHYRADGEPNRADLEGFLSDWKPSIHMHRAASRITLEVTGVRVEQLQDISEADAIAEGIEHDQRLDPAGTCHWRVYGQERTGTNSPERSYQTLWESINGPDSWAANPWVWVVEFKRVEQPA